REGLTERGGGMGGAGTVAEALAAAHRVGLVHGAIDPWSVKGADAPRLSVDLTGLDARAASGVNRAVAAFRDPEAPTGTGPTAEADVYALGRLAAWLLGGGDGADVHRELPALLGSMTARDPFDRPTMAEAARRLAAVLADLELQRTEALPGAGGETSEWQTKDQETVEEGLL